MFDVETLDVGHLCVCIEYDHYGNFETQPEGGGRVGGPEVGGVFDDGPHSRVLHL